MKNKINETIAITIILVIAVVGIVIWLFLIAKIKTNENINSDQNIKVEYSKSELDTSWDATNAIEIVFNENNVTSSNESKASVNNSVVTIKSAGEYHIKGTCNNGQIIVEADKEDDIQLILDNVNLTCSNSAPIFIKQADKVIITLEDGTTNTLKDGENYILDDEEEPCATIFSKEDLVINGTGALNIEANYEKGIVSKDDLKIISGNIIINSKDDGIRGKDSVVIKDGTIEITSGGDAIKSSNSDGSDVGYIVIENGKITISSAQDGIQAESKLQIDGGKINIKKSDEGLEASQITINNGEIYVVASDDGVNVSSGDGTSQMNGRPGQNIANSSNSNNKITINGGYLYVDAKGDGLDANGSIVMTGGKVIVNGPTNDGNGALDYDGTFEISDGVLIAAGSSGMLQTVSNNSTINCISVTFDSNMEAGTLVSVKDSNDNEIISYSPSKTFQSIVICSSKDIKTGETYKVYANGSLVTELTINGVVTSYGKSGMNGMGGMPGVKMQPKVDMNQMQNEKQELNKYK